MTSMNLALADRAFESATDYCAIGRLAQRALYLELQCYPKPGLVSPSDNGSHSDMDAATFIRSIAALANYFPAIATAGAESAPFSRLQALGRVAEQRMLRATAGVNTHRGAIFHLGLLAAAAGALMAARAPLRDSALGDYVQSHWGDAIVCSVSPGSHGHSMTQQFHVAGARHEAACGFPRVFDLGLPALRAGLARGANFPCAMVQCFFTLMADVCDTNLLYRGGFSGLVYAQKAARDFLDAGGVFHKPWLTRAHAAHREFMERRLSPGGSADLLAAVLFVHGLQEHENA